MNTKGEDSPIYFSDTSKSTKKIDKMDKTVVSQTTSVFTLSLCTSKTQSGYVGDSNTTK